jgi:16S rRNA (cytosine967-C5)-methyltransferase
MSESSRTSIRGIAAEVLAKSRKQKKFAGELLEFYPQLTERPRATDLVFGVIRNRVLIDLVIEKVSGRLIEHIPSRILNILRVGVYELIYCPQEVEYAIVSEAVENTKHITNAKQAGFVNAVLRKTQKHIINRGSRLDQAQPRNTIPQTMDTGCEFDIEILPERDASPLEYLNIGFSLPGWLVESWLAEYGVEQTREICFAINRRPGIYLRPNLLRTTAEELSGKLKADGFDCEIIPTAQMIKPASPGSITSLPGFDEGLFTIQDLSAAQAVRLLNPQPGWTILDLCAAPGTKTTQLAELSGAKAKIIATDINGGRLEMVRENINRLGLSDCVTTIEYPALDGFFREDGFDCVLVDAPCSNTGVLARRPEVRHRLKKSSINELAAVQIELLSKAADMLKPHGVICYSTCSIQPRENSLLVKQFLKGHTGFGLREEKLVLPSARRPDHDGAYTAIVERV